MEKSVLRGSAPRLCSIALAALATVFSPRAASGFTPNSAEVRQAVARAIQFLEKDSGMEGRPGAHALVGIALLKNGASPSHPRVVYTVKVLRDAIRRAEDPTKITFDIYSAALSIVFFVTLDPNRYGPEVQALLIHLQSKQKPHGGWGYDVRSTGDTSMTQNAVLAFWEAKSAGVRVPVPMVEGGLIWLLKTQDPGGGFGYQGNTSNDFTPVPQAEIRPSMAGAGLGSLYICADFLRIGKPPEKETDLPPALKEVKQREPPPASRIDPRLVQQALARGKAWMAQNFTVDQGRYQLYNLYTVERYHTFREMAEGTVETEPRWYNDGVRYLLSQQKADGSWSDQCGATAATAFGVLFLIRSTKISVEGKRSFGDGTLIGGRGLPKHTAGLAVVRGNVVSKPELGALDKVLASLDDSTSPDYTEAVEALAELPAEAAETFVSKYAKKLQDLAGDKSPEARLAAVRALGKTRNLDCVPTLIYALTDPDPVVMQAARDSLRRISRKFQGFGLSDNPGELELHTAIRKWQEWYRAIRPDADFED